TALPLVATALQIQNALEKFVTIGTGHVTVTGSAGTFTIALHGTPGLKPTLNCVAAATTAFVPKLVVTWTVGAYVLTDGTDFVAPAPNAAPIGVQKALESFASIGTNLQVTPVGSGQFEISGASGVTLPTSLIVSGTGAGVTSNDL